MSQMAGAVQVWSDPKASFNPTATIRKSGDISFSRGARNKFGFGKDIRHVKLAYDNRTSTIVVIPAQANDHAAVELKIIGGPVVLFCRKFCERFDVDFKETRRFVLEKLDSYPGLETETPVYTVALTSAELGSSDSDEESSDDAADGNSDG